MIKNLLCTAILFSSSIANASLIFSFDSSDSSWVGQGESRYITDQTYDIRIRENHDNGLWFRFNDKSSSDYWSLDLAAPNNEILDVGFYGNAARFPFQDVDQPGLTFSGNHRGNNRNAGFFEIYEIGYDALGDLAFLSMDFTQYGEQNESWWLTGNIQYNLDKIITVTEPSILWLLCAGLFASCYIRSRATN